MFGFFKLFSIFVCRFCIDLLFEDYKLYFGLLGIFEVYFDFLLNGLDF